jgi:ribosome-associated translation inhibitor RaiA
LYTDPVVKESDMAEAYLNNKLRIQIDAHQCQLSPAEVRKMQSGLDVLAREVQNFPVSDLHVLVEHNARNTDYNVKTSLFLTGETLVSSDHDARPFTAFERCVANLEKDVHAYKERMGRVPERQKQSKGTRQLLEPTVDPDPAALDAAVRDGDFAAFRAAAYGYEEPLRKRIGRWVERYPEVNARIDKTLKIEDIVEEVFLDAFEGYDQHPKDVRLGDWLERLIDPAIKDLQQHPDEELENVRLARSAEEAELGPEAS